MVRGRDIELLLLLSPHTKKNRKLETEHTQISLLLDLCTVHTHTHTHNEPKYNWSDPYATLSKYILNLFTQPPVNRVVLGTHCLTVTTCVPSYSFLLIGRLWVNTWGHFLRNVELWGSSAVGKLSIQNVCVETCWVNYEPAGKHDRVMTSHSTICRKRETPGRISHHMFLKRYTLARPASYGILLWLDL